ncbi:HAD hydrolase-like protein [Zhihengliuella sp.]|uniref:HAD hydrolase-like protein n=1 Tax=Zhihengliuella sp. TaxID=1954483 RepID=UPI0028113E1E|nr:HAD hydrolase-like protein [Zhihengliuella sp.]
MNPAPAARSAVVFDLDGTLVDPAGAITTGLAEALAAHGVPVPTQQVLDAMIGPPLATSVAAVPGVRPEDVQSIIEHYRAGYLAHGMAASRVYPGIVDLLEDLGRRGVARAVATSKPVDMARRLMRIQGIVGLFETIHGADPDEAKPHAGKAAIVGEALTALGLAEIDPEERGRRAVMVGDRYFDVEGAHAHALPCIGVEWGYAPEGELAAAGADAIASDAEALRTALGRLLPDAVGLASAAESGDAPAVAGTGSEEAR